MAITIGGVNVYDTVTMGTTFNLVVTADANPNRAIYVAFSHQIYSGNITSITLNGVALTSVYQDSATPRLSLYRIIGDSNVQVGGNTVSVTIDQSRESVAGIIALSGVDQSTPNRAVSNSTGGSTAPQATGITSNSGELLFGFGNEIDHRDVTAFGGGTSRWEYVSDFGTGWASTITSVTTSASMSWTLNQSSSWKVAAISIVPAADAGGAGSGSATGTAIAAATVSGLGALVGTAAGTGTMSQASQLVIINGSAAGIATTTGNTLAYYAPLTGYSYGGWAAGIVTLGWNANTESNLAGYRIYIGTTSGVYDLNTSRYTSPVNVGLVTTYTFTQLTGPTTYYFAITAFDDTGGESAFSSEISWFVPDYGVITGSLSNSTGALTGSSTGTSIAQGFTYNIGALVGLSAGSGATTGFAIASSAGAVAGIINASGAATATIGGDGRLANTFIVGSSTATGTVDGGYPGLSGESDGESTITGEVLGDGALIALAAGVGSASLVVSQSIGVIQHQKRSPERGNETRHSRKR